MSESIYSKKMLVILIVIFFLAVAIRFLYFPNNIYFGFDQARDAYGALDILKGDLKLIGPTTAFEGLHHGVLYYYILAPLYGLGKMSPEVVAAALRIFNALGIFLVFLTAKTIFDKRVGLFAALFFALSFEQSQFSIYMGNPSLAVLSLTIFYLGLILVIFGGKNFGLIIAALGFGASVQFQFALSYLVLPLILIFLIYRRIFLKIPIKTWSITFLTLIFSLSTFLLAELRYNFQTVKGLLALSQFNPDKNLETIFNTYLFTVSKMVTYNFSGNWQIVTLITALFALSFILLLKIKENRPKFIFLGIWFFSIFLSFVINGGVANLQRDIPLFYPNVGVSVSLLIFVAFLIDKLYKKTKPLALFLIILIAFSNLSLIKVFNPNGTISEISVQQGMTLGLEKKVLDYLYSESEGEPFAVKAVTMPFFVNTTWSYLFEWYGLKKYGYMPLWNGKNALGYAGNLKVQETQEGLAANRFLIMEPTRGIATYLIEDYLKEEGYFTKVMDEKKIGAFIIQKREKF